MGYFTILLCVRSYIKKFTYRNTPYYFLKFPVKVIAFVRATWNFFAVCGLEMRLKGDMPQNWSDIGL